MELGFILWHRRFMLGYENMLRSLHPDFECVTLPYWNYFHHYDLMQKEEPLHKRPYTVASIMREMPKGNALRSEWFFIMSFPPSAGLPALEEALNVDSFKAASTNIEQNFHSKYYPPTVDLASPYSRPHPRLARGNNGDLRFSHGSDVLQSSVSFSYERLRSMEF